MPRPLKQGTILGASTIILSKDIDEYAFMCGSNFYESDVSWFRKSFQLESNTTYWEVVCTYEFWDLERTLKVSNNSAS